MLKRLLILLILLMPGLLTPVQASKLDMQEYAERYLALYLSHNARALARYYNPDSKLKDPTANKTYSGVREILRFIRRSKIGLKNKTFLIERSFQAYKTVTFVGIYELETEGSLFGCPGQDISLRVPAVIALKINTKSNTVDEHLELVDYHTLKEQTIICR